MHRCFRWAVCAHYCCRHIPVHMSVFVGPFLQGDRRFDLLPEPLIVLCSAQSDTDRHNGRQLRWDDCKPEATVIRTEAEIQACSLYGGQHTAGRKRVCLIPETHRRWTATRTLSHCLEVMSILGYKWHISAFRSLNATLLTRGQRLQYRNRM